MEREGENASLRSPLIQISEQDGVKVDNDTQRNKRRVAERREIFEEVKKQLWLAGPLIFVGLLNFCIQIISVMFVGHLGELPLSGASMATSFASVTGISLLALVDLDALSKQWTV
ncbi:MATE efflux family protein LAL5 [Spatholobus suberectus]|nr:MATE efflux family protein LAL5 [Spatholobus suberectus]